MSQILFGCTVAKAMCGNEEETLKLASRLRQPSFTFMGFAHEPRCPKPDDAQMKRFCDSFQRRFPKEAVKLAEFIERL